MKHCISKSELILENSLKINKLNVNLKYINEQNKSIYNKRKKINTIEQN